jgi:predicted HicB family RNase H-like nuclease
MNYIIEVKLPSTLLNHVVVAAKSLDLSTSDYVQRALLEKVKRWIHNECSEEVSYSEFDCITGSMKLSDELLGQVERAAKSLGLSVDDFLYQALQEKVNRLPQDIVHKGKMDRAIEHVFKKNGELFRRLAEWPTAESASR